MAYMYSDMGTQSVMFIVNRLRRRFVLIVCFALSTIWILHVFYTQGSDHLLPVPVHQRLQLSLNLTRDVKTRDVIVKHYIHNLQTQLENRAQQTQVENDSIYTQRKQYVNKYCQRQEDTNRMPPGNIRDLHWYLDKPRIMYCPVAKSGSTFWRRAFEVIRRKDPKIVSPFQLSYMDFKLSKAKIPLNMTETAHVEDMSKLLQKTLKFLFARDPYSRVFSTFIDKILSPNTYMWGLGKNAIEMFRSSNTERTSTCGSDVSFDEYVKYINTRKFKTIDFHLRPVAYRCDACVADYDVIGKLETFEDDIRYILKKVGSYDSEIIFKNMNIEYKVDYILDAVVRAFDFKKGWTQCISLHAGYQRLWRQLQIGGMIDKTDPYLLTPEQSSNITVTEYLNMALEAFKRSGPSAKGNKKEAFLQAYSMVSLKEMESLRKNYLVDFEMFDYNQRPRKLFNINREAWTDFDYFDVMRLR
ncbi:carbohydrate sulfotransferase 11-like [Haliotis cracherodii]|uniref:carbohydrate sulfotransferase 11-like n=1 Tax=Haliotis cracherodii TaxID=6455 RepID=UPI0039E7FC11